jgi:hypothetical protein
MGGSRPALTERDTFTHTVPPAVATNLTRKVGETSSNSRKDTGNRKRQDRVALTMFHETDAHEPEQCCRRRIASGQFENRLPRCDDSI